MDVGVTYIKGQVNNVVVKVPGVFRVGPFAGLV